LNTAIFFIISLLLLLPACGMDDQISPETMNKLDARLQLLFDVDAGLGNAPDPVGRNEQGEDLYSVIIRTDNAEQLRDAGLKPDAVIGTIVTARLTKSEILLAAGLESTQSVEADSDLNFPQNDL
jgi:hypothetical protein